MRCRTLFGPLDSGAQCCRMSTRLYSLLVVINIYSATEGAVKKENAEASFALSLLGNMRRREEPWNVVKPFPVNPYRVSTYLTWHKNSTPVVNRSRNGCPRPRPFVEVRRGRRPFFQAQSPHGPWLLDLTALTTRCTCENLS